MATYAELYTLSLDASLVQRLTIAVAIAAEVIRSESGDVPYHAERVAWAKRALANPDGTARQLLMIALAQNKDLTAAQIAAASDAALQSAVADAIALLL